MDGVYLKLIPSINKCFFGTGKKSMLIVATFLVICLLVLYYWSVVGNLPTHVRNPPSAHVGKIGLNSSHHGF